MKTVFTDTSSPDLPYSINTRPSYLEIGLLYMHLSNALDPMSLIQSIDRYLTDTAVLIDLVPNLLNTFILVATRMNGVLNECW